MPVWPGRQAAVEAEKCLNRKSSARDARGVVCRPTQCACHHAPPRHARQRWRSSRSAQRSRGVAFRDDLGVDVVLRAPRARATFVLRARANSQHSRNNRQRPRNPHTGSSFALRVEDAPFQKPQSPPRPAAPSLIGRLPPAPASRRTPRPCPRLTCRSSLLGSTCTSASTPRRS